MCQICIKALVDRAASKAFPAPREPETVGEQCRQMSGAPEWDVTQPEYAPFGSQGNPPTGGVDWNEQDLHPKPLRKRRPLGQGCDHV